MGFIFFGVPGQARTDTPKKARFSGNVAFILGLLACWAFAGTSGRGGGEAGRGGAGYNH